MESVGTVTSRPVIPPLSVVMPVHNALPYLDEAVESILAQTFTDFEFVIWDDGSIDGSTERLRHWAGRDARIRLVGDGMRHGPSGSSNRVVAAARAALIARMDADDIAKPDRLQRQMDVLNRHPQATLIGSLFDMIDEHGRHLRDAANFNRLGGALRPPFCHPSILFRAESFHKIGGYRPAADRWEDLDLYLRFATTGDMLILPDVLISVRLSGSTTRFRDGDKDFEAATDLMFRCLRHYRETGEYESLLREGVKTTGRVSPSVFVSSGATELWRGKRPHALWKLLRRAKLEPGRELLTALTWCLWAEIEPRSLRWALQQNIKLRNRLAGAAGKIDRVTRWPYTRDHIGRNEPT